jgi:pimeloyl-ACP methyl ester carboxylesterase
MRHACVILLALLLTSTGHAAPAASAPDISGTWQATTRFDGSLPARIVWQISRDSGGWQLLGYNIDRGPDAVRASSVSVDGMTVKVTLDTLQGTYEGTLSPDRQSIEGTWKQQGTGTPLVLHRATKRTAWKLDSSLHTVRFVTVDHDVPLEVLDWGGKGQPIVLLAGLGNNAHVYDQFAPNLTASHHVLAITRRGFGASSVPAGGYAADRLGDDVLEVLQALKILRPILVGHSIAGEELSSIGTRYPQKVAALIYLDAAYGYAFYPGGDLNFDVDEVRRKLDILRQGDGRVAQELLATDLPRLTSDLQVIPKDGTIEAPIFIGPPPQWVSNAIFAGGRHYGPFGGVPILAIFAYPPQGRPNRIFTEKQAAYLEQAIPDAHVVRLANAEHDVFRSNAMDVLREINAFIAGLPPSH